MHDSRGASLQVGDRVLVEAEITELQPQSEPDTNGTDVSRGFQHQDADEGW